MTTQIPPDFFLASSESYSFKGPFQCWVEAKVIGEIRNDYLLVRISPAAIDFITEEPLDKILIVGRDKPINLYELPINVYIAKIKDKSVFKTYRCNKTNIEVVTSGDIFMTLEEANDLAKTVQ